MPMASLDAGLARETAAVKSNFDFVKKPKNAADAAALLDRYARTEIVAPKASAAYTVSG